MPPVFVDRTGRRRRLFTAAGAAGGLVLCLVSLLLIAGFTGTGPDYLPTLPESVRGPVRTTPSGKPAPSPRPSRSPDAVRTTRSATVAPATTAPSPTAKANHRRVPTQTPANRPSKPA
jgi:hypothetical protein